MPNSLHPEKLYLGLSSKELSHFAQASADISFVLDDLGSVQNVYSVNENLAKYIPEDLIGKKWLDIVEPDSRTKVQRLLEDANSNNLSKFRQINVIGNQKNIALPMMCASIKTLSNKKIIVIGRDLTEASKLQQSLVAAQKEISQNYLQITQLEERFQSIFEIGTESIIIVRIDDAYPIVEMNRNAMKQLLLLAKNNCIGKSLLSLLPANELSNAKTFLQGVQDSDEPKILKTLFSRGEAVQISATSFTNGGIPYLLLNLKPLDLAEATSLLAPDSLTIKAIENNAYGFVVCTPEGLILKANKAFNKLSSTKGEKDLIGTNIRDYLGPETADFDLMMQSLKGKASSQSCISSVSNASSSI
jgi:transcriptional regulator PpsR